MKYVSNNFSICSCYYEFKNYIFTSLFLLSLIIGMLHFSLFKIIPNTHILIKVKWKLYLLWFVIWILFIKVVSITWASCFLSVLVFFRSTAKCLLCQRWELLKPISTDCTCGQACHSIRGTFTIHGLHFGETCVCPRSPLLPCLWRHDPSRSWELLSSGTLLRDLRGPTVSWTPWRLLFAPCFCHLAQPYSSFPG